MRMGTKVVFGALLIVVPLLHLAVAFVLWELPVTHRARRKLFVALEVLGAWSALDVTLVSVVMSFLQVGRFATFIVGDKCDALGPVLRIPAVTELLDGDDKCIDVKVDFLGGLWWMVGVALLAIATTEFVKYKARPTARGHDTSPTSSSPTQSLSPAPSEAFDAGRTGADSDADPLLINSFS